MVVCPPTRWLTAILTEEHELLLRALGLFGRYSELLVVGRPYDPRLARGFLRFFRDFGDVRHHEKEEQLLFPWMEAQGLPREVGPLGVLRQEHELARDLRLALSLAADALLVFPGDGDARVRFHALAVRFVELMTAHIEKEEQVLFPLADRFSQQGREPLERPSVAPTKELAWVARLEEEAATWPSPRLSLHGLGTPYGFERLCEESLAAPG